MGSVSNRTGAEGDDRKRGVLSFLVLFAVYIVVGHLLFDVSWVERTLVDRWTSANTQLAAALAGPLGVDEPHVDGDRLVGHGGSVVVRRGCDGLTAVLILCSTVLAFPAPWPRRLVGLAAGTLAIFAVNAVRLASLLVVAVRWPARIEFFHIDVWQPMMVLISFVLFLTWGIFLARPAD